MEFRGARRKTGKALFSIGRSISYTFSTFFFKVMDDCMPILNVFSSTLRHQVKIQ